MTSVTCLECVFIYIYIYYLFVVFIQFHAAYDLIILFLKLYIGEEEEGRKRRRSPDNIYSLLMFLMS